MKKSQIKAFIILAFMLSILLFNSFITKIFSQYSICAFILSMGIISYFILGYQKEKSRYNKDIILSILSPREANAVIKLLRRNFPFS